MPFDKFGKMSFVPNAKASPFVDYLKKGKIRGTKCKSCRELYFPPRGDCLHCFSSDMEWVDFSGKGKLVTYTTIHVPPAGFEEVAPYTLCLVDLKEGGRLLAWLEESKEENLKIGMDVTILPKDLGNERIAYVVKP